MVQSLKLGAYSADGEGSQHAAGNEIRRLNRLPIFIAILLIVAFLAVIFFGLASRRLVFREDGGADALGDIPASSYADQMKRGVADGIIGEPQPQQISPSPPVDAPPAPQSNPFSATKQPDEVPPRANDLEPEAVWRARLQREQQEQILREQQRQRMARMQAADIARDSPLAVSTDKLQTASAKTGLRHEDGQTNAPPSQTTTDLYGAALQAGLSAQNVDPNGQRSKEAFFNSDLAKLGYLPNRVVGQQSPFELKRGSVIPATLITGINSDLPGRITAQVSQSVYDSASGYRLLIPQGTRLMGRYDSKVAFGQSRVLVVWTDLIFPNGSTLQIGGMAGSDAEGYGGFSDEVDNHYFRTFSSAVLVALIGAGIDAASPNTTESGTTVSAAEQSFVQTFGQFASSTVSKNLDVQPTLEIRPGYQFNVLVDQDIVFPGDYRGLAK